ncbi:hypothetical protein MADA3029_p0066 [Vibrio nigripulchritudo MADA3029]|uniref:hypothetical protein n=1 Tax=Vibrio nigripulchritudo TaxID=28173 RepID=UPI0003B21863|nr:hypothetical protein [Vibrio nigripulchritudo]CCN50833.1 hypothetical protein VIBNIMADA3020_p0066 [Vibrio nigripulchritudo MADA3020]CCN56691.1 hypothetical protein VIBNIMADA3021_p0066 [Vibrio nigripulchritudo MADA3021]CCN62548.1 hypothetical protein MADA3029_p0066 [Vibrio nigripulchritudo MADA3029]
MSSSKNTLTYFFNEPYQPGSHEAIHRAQKPHVGSVQGACGGSQDELVKASRAGLKDVDHIKGDLKIPVNGEVLSSNVTPEEAFDKLVDWHTE